MKTLTQVVGFIVLALGLIFASGLVLSVMWGWFIVRMGIPPITVPQALGLSLIVSFLTYKPKENTDQSTGEAFLASLFLYAFYLVYGFILTLFL